MEFSIKDFFSKCDQIRRIWSHLLKKSLMVNLIFYVVSVCFWFGLCLETGHKNFSNPVAFTLASRQVIYSDTIPAPFQSFISQECDTDIKYSFTGTRSNLILPVVRKYIKRLQYKFQLGYFNIKQLVGNRTLGLHHMTKYCFEPHQLTLKEIKQIENFNRASKSSLIPEEVRSPSSAVAGVAIVIDKETQDLAAIYFALKSTNVGYKRVYYKRWKGESFDEAL